MKELNFRLQNNPNPEKRILEVRYYNHNDGANLWIIEAIFRANGQVVMSNGHGGEWYERVATMRPWFEVYYPEILDDLREDPIKGFPMTVDELPS